MKKLRVIGSIILVPLLIVTLFSNFIPLTVSADNTITVTIDTVDPNGNHLAEGTYNLSTPTPYVTSMPNGNLTGFMCAWNYGRSPTIYLNPFEGKTYWYDGLTGEFIKTTSSDPGTARIFIVFLPLDMTIDTVNQDGVHLEGGEIGFGAARITPYNTQVANGAAIWLIECKWGGINHPPYIFQSVFDSKTYWYDGVTGELIKTTACSPGTTHINIVFQQISLTMDTVDQSGAHIDGLILTEGTHTAPYTKTMANGGTIWLWASALGVQSPESLFLSVFQGKTYWYDGITGELTKVTVADDPGSAKINIVFGGTKPAPQPVTLIYDTVDPSGVHLDGTVSVPGSNGTIQSPFVTTAESGGTFGWLYFSWGGVPGREILLNVNEGTTYWIDGRTGEPIKTTTAEAGTARIYAVFKPMTITYDTVDPSGVHLDGTVSVPGSNGTTPSPFVTTGASGGTFGWLYFSWGYVPTRDYLQTFSDGKTYWIDGRTGELLRTTNADPGKANVYFVFQPITLTYDTVDSVGGHLDGTVDVPGSNGNVPSPFVTKAGKGGQFGWLNFSWNGFPPRGGILLNIWEGKTYWINAITGEPIKTTISPSGTSRIYAVFSTNSPPVANANGPYVVNEGGSVILNGSGSDPDGDPLTYEWDLNNDGIFEVSGQAATFSAVGRDGPGSQIVVLKVSDNQGASATSSATVTINNVAPGVNQITAPVDPVQIGTTVNVMAGFTDAGTLDTHTASCSWGDGTTSAGIVNETQGTGSVTGEHSYTHPGVYTITLTVTDNNNASGSSIFQYVVIYDPNGGFVTGGGWINSSAGAYTANPSLTGKATFGFVAKYEKGATVPTGNTEFQFNAGNLNFKSTSYEWMVVAGGKAQYKGIGTINGIGNYRFMLTVIDGDLLANGKEADTFRIRIWGDNGLIYDNQLNAPDDADPSTVLGGGSIVIHK